MYADAKTIMSEFMETGNMTDQVKKRAPLDQAFSEQLYAIETLESNTRKLKEALTPVLEPDSPAQTAPGCDQTQPVPPQSPVVNGLNIHTERILVCVTEIQEILRRLEV